MESFCGVIANIAPLKGAYSTYLDYRAILTGVQVPIAPLSCGRKALESAGFPRFPGLGQFFHRRLEESCSVPAFNNIVTRIKKMR